MKPTFELSKEEKEEMTALIQKYFEEKSREPMGNLDAMMLLDFFTEKLAPSFYNIGVEDCHAYMTSKIDDIFEIQK